MTIQEVSDAELSKWIAEQLGWRFGTAEQYGPKYGGNSLGQCWWFHSRPYAVSELPNISDPAITVMLLERARLILRPTDNGWTAFNEPRNTATAETPGRAIAEAFALSQGWSG